MTDIISQIIELHNEKNICLTGMTDEFFCWYIKSYFEKNQRDIIIISSTLYEANNLYKRLINYVPDTLLFPMDDFITSESIAISPDLKINRLESINELLTVKNHILITHLNGLLRYLPTKELYLKSNIKLSKDQEYDRDLLIKKLIELGYTKETIVTKTGEIGIRGFIIDIYPLGEEHPIRIEYFGDLIDSIRVFDENTQITIKEVDDIIIKPYTEFIVDNVENSIINNQKNLPIYNKKISNISNYMKNPLFVFKDYNSILNEVSIIREQIIDYKNRDDSKYEYNYMFDFDEIIYDDFIHYNSIDSIDPIIPLNKTYKYSIKSIAKFNENIELIKKYLKDQLELGKIIIVFLKKYQIKSFINYIDLPNVITDENTIFKDRINIINKEVLEGFEYNNYVILTENELFNKVLHEEKYKTSFKYATRIKNISNLEVGDYVVHNINGIGIYNGIKTLSQNGLLKDYLEILYQGKDKLYIPIEKINLINKYAGKEGAIPKINKLGSSEWTKTKIKVQSKVKDIASDLIKLYAQREMQKGYAFSKDNELQEMFESEFIYTPTNDQLLAINQIKTDMESIKPMDRLLCGDVGFGKTEVAFRAMFKAVNDGKQVLYLCPTTILSIQQYKNAIERFKNYPVNISVLNRFTSKKQAREILEDLKNGKVDILFGTHRILSDDIKPKKLGLLVIDEEQRFGVTHKEKLKKYKENVDVLTLSATPIPRTLQMSLIGIRSLSLIETPPINRYPVQTYVIAENKTLIKEAIYKELSRGGQIFILYNDINKLSEIEYNIKRLVPESKIIIAHGQLEKNELEDRMTRFINQEYDILLCTTIIETGIDIPNVNTLIILNADHFGLSQLYQIRGRVGRSDKIAYAYLMYNNHKELNDNAVKRLNAIKEFTELGSGFRIASRDLSIRGAGDILGSEQAGFIDSVGIDMYLKILEDEIKLIKGEKIEEEINEDNKQLINVSTHIKDELTNDEKLKIEIHKKINEIDSYGKLIEVKTELEDRFGKLDQDVIIYMHEEWFEKLSKKLGIINVLETKKFIKLTFSPEKSKKIDIEEFFVEACKITNMFRFEFSKDSLILVIETVKLEKHPIFYILAILNKIKYKD